MLKKVLLYMFMIVLFLPGVLLLLFYVGLLIYYRLSWSNIPLYEPVPPVSSTTVISVIIPARNEALNLPVLLQSLRAQTYPADLFEVLIIDDFSTDATAATVSSYAGKNMRLLSLKDHIGDETFNAYKKKAIETGIGQSTGTLIVTTDADCYLPPHWLQTIAAFYEEKKPVFIAAPVAINDRISFIELFQSLDFMTLQGITGAGVHKKFHSMCNGANMAYEREAFIEVGGFRGVDDIASGDDMLLMHKISKRYPGRILFLKSRDVIVETAPAKTIGAFFNQRIRWASKANKYDDKSMLPVLSVVYFLNAWMLVFPLIAIAGNTVFPMLAVTPFGGWLWILLIKIIVELIFLYPVAAFFRKRYLLWLFPIMQPFHIIYTVIAGWLGVFGSYKWKDRKVQ